MVALSYSLLQRMQAHKTAKNRDYKNGKEDKTSLTVARSWRSVS